jgi:hypothetical protein
MPGWGWASFLVPLFHCYTTPQGVPLQAGQAFLPSYYVGVGTVALALLALVRVRDRRLRVLALVACLGLVWSLGENGRVFGWMRKALPWVGLTRFPIKFVYLVAFAAPFLAAYGLRSLRESGGQAPRQTLRWLAPLVGALWLAIAGLVWLGYSGPAPGENPGTTLVSGASRAVCLGAILGAAFLCVRQAPGRRRGISEAAVVVLAAADLWTHHPHLLPVIPSWAYREKVPLPQPVPGAGTARAFITPRAEGLLQTRTLREFLPDFLGSRLALWSNLNVLEGIPKVNGAATLQIREQAEVEWGLYGGTNEFPAVLRFLGVSHCSSPQSPVEWQPCPNPLPWVTVGQRPSFGSHEEALRTLFDPGFEPAETVCLPLEARGAFPAARRVPAQATGLRFSANEVEFRVDAPEATVAVVAQSYYPRWRAWVDGRPADLWRANGAFQAVAVPAGRHEVRLAYVDRGFHAGLVVSGISAAGCLALGLAGRRRMG